MASKALYVACLLATLCVATQAAQVVHLDKQQWTISNANASVTVPGVSLPAYPLEVLREAGIIKDPKYRFGELESRWVALDTWTFSLAFMGNESGMAEALSAKQVLLQLGGIDTFANVTLNGKLLLQPNNFHRSWAVPVKEVLTSGLNTLVITIKPAAPETVSLKATHPYTIPALQQLGSIGAYVFARKPASDFGWDWGPAYAASGIHGFVNLLAFDAATLTSAFVAQSLIKAESGNKFAINVTSQFVIPAGGDAGTLQVEVPKLGIKERQNLVLSLGQDATEGLSLRKGSGGLLMATFNTNLTIDEDAVELWWPTGYGEQFMYDVVVSFAPDTMQQACAIAIDDKTPAAAPAARRRLLDSFVAAAAEEADYTSDMPGSLAVDSSTIVAGAAALPAACAVAVRDYSTFRRRIGFRTVELVRLPIAAAVKDLFPEGESGWGLNAEFYQQKDNSDGHWAQTKDGIWKHFDRKANQSDVDGESFYFKVNGVPMYMKGANYIPSHIVHTEASTQMLNDTLQYALDSNMNMIRVWGGGRYPVQSLFHFADEHGILIWMETMFACAPYPRDPDFLNNVGAEVAQQVQRLSWHPSVAIWGGNNEIEGSLNWYAESRSNRAMFANDYQALFIDTIRREIRRINPAIPFVDSSPSNGVIADNDKEYVKRWGDDWDWRYGDVHWYAYESDCEDWTTYPKSKFISEFGSQSYPTFATYAEATAPEDWQVDNNMTGFRNRRFGNGLEMFEAQFKRHFRLPASWKAPNDPVKALKLFKSFFYITHMQQARCYEAAINYWRRLRSQPAGLTMGVLYWQLNDIAHFASWSSYDYGGRWKPLAYSVKRMYAPLQVQAFTDGDTFKVFLVNDRVTPVATTVQVSLVPLEQTSASCRTSENGDAVTSVTASNATTTTTTTTTTSSTTEEKEVELQQQQQQQEPHDLGVASVLRTDFEVLPNFASQVWEIKTSALLRSRPSCTPATCYVAVTAVAKPGQPGAGEVSETQVFFVPLKDIKFTDPGMALTNFALASSSAARAGADAPATLESAAAAAKVNSADSLSSATGAAAAPARTLLQTADSSGSLRSRMSAGGRDGALLTPRRSGGSGAASRRQEAVHGGGVSGSVGAGSGRDTAAGDDRVSAGAGRGGSNHEAAHQSPATAAPLPAAPLPEAPSEEIIHEEVIEPGTPISFTLSTTRPAVLTNFLTRFRGHFSDDAFTALHPCAPKRITFFPHVSAGPISAAEFAADLKVESLFNHQYGEPQPAVAAAASTVVGTAGGAASVAGVAGGAQPSVVAAAAAAANAAHPASALIAAVESKRHTPN